VSYYTRAETLIYLKNFFPITPHPFSTNIHIRLELLVETNPLFYLKFLFSDKVTYLLSKLTTSLYSKTLTCKSVDAGFDNYEEQIYNVS